MALRLLCILTVLVLPACYKTVISPVHVNKNKAVYQVRSGDTLYSISQRYGMDYRALGKRNHIRYPYAIHTGQRLYLRRVAPRPSYIPLPEKHKKTVHNRRTGDKRTDRHGRMKSSRHTISHRHMVRLIWPVHGPVTSGFGRRHGRPHDGIDIGVPEGTPVRAAAAGEVVYSSHRLTGYGNLIIIRHTHDMFTAYAHNQINLVRKGDHVKRGEIIARTGHTGHASGPHLHFEVRRGPTPVNPLAYLSKR